MGSTYSFETDKPSYVRNFNLMSRSALLFLITSLLTLVSSLLFFGYFDQPTSEISLALWIFEIAITILQTVSILLLVIGIKTIKNYFDGKILRYLKLSVIFFSIYLSVNFIYSISNFVYRFLGDEYGGLLLAKTFCVQIFITIALFLLSLSFNKMQIAGYNTRLLITPIAMLTIPSVFMLPYSFILIFNGDLVGGSGMNILDTIAIFVYAYYALSLLIISIEYFFSVRNLNLKVQLSTFVGYDDTNIAKKTFSK